MGMKQAGRPRAAQPAPEQAPERTLPGKGIAARLGAVVYADTAPLGPPGPANQGPGASAPTRLS